MGIVDLLSQGFAVALQPTNLLLATAGVFVGTLVGMLPGIGPINGIAVLIPITFALGLPPESTLILFAGIYYGSQFGNSISTILLNVPGTAAAVVTALDGYAMTQSGRAGPALAMSAIASFFGGTISIVALMFFAPLLSEWAIRFGPVEYFALMVFALSTVSSLAGKSLPKALLATCFGLILATVGLDPNSGVRRYTFGAMKLLDGMDFVVVTIGLFAISEVLKLLEEVRIKNAVHEAIGRITVSLREMLGALWTMTRASITGFFVGTLPGAGATIASFVAYTTEKRLVDRDNTFGSGDIRGVAAPEAANNAAANGALIPLLTLGVPGSGTTAVILAALLGMNITPGPLFIENNAGMFWSLVASMYIGNVILLLLNLPLVGVFVRILRIPRWFLLPSVVAISFVAVYAVNNSSFDLLLMTGFGLLGYLMQKTGFPLAPVILGLVLGPLMETNLRRALTLSDGDWSILVSSPIAIGIWIITVVGLFLPQMLAIFNDQVKTRNKQA